MFNSILMVFLGGGLGSVLRFLISKSVLQEYAKNLPLATFISNMIACTILGLVVYLLKSKGAVAQSPVVFFWIVGFCGGLSTFSTFSLESLQLLRQGMYFYFFVNLLFSVLMGMTVIYLFISKYHSPNESI